MDNIDDEKLKWMLLFQGNVPVLSAQEQCEMTKQLEQLSQRSEVALHPGPLALDKGTIIPPVSLTLLPKIISFKLQPPDAAWAAHKLKLSAEEEEKLNGPFLFTPIQFGSFRKQPNYKQQVLMGSFFFLCFLTTCKESLERSFNKVILICFLSIYECSY